MNKTIQIRPGVTGQFVPTIGAIPTIPGPTIGGIPTLGKTPPTFPPTTTTATQTTTRQRTTKRSTTDRTTTTAMTTPAPIKTTTTRTITTIAPTTTRKTKTSTRAISTRTNTTTRPPHTTPVANASTHTPNREVCYPEVGCFENSPPFDNAFNVLPASPSSIGTTFLLFSRRNPNRVAADTLNYTRIDSLRTSHFNPSLPTKFIIHGLGQSIDADWMHTMKDELLIKGDMNVVVVGWGDGATIIDYDSAAANTRVVGMQVKLLVDRMVSLGSRLTNIHLIGHSLGAHTSGYTGRRLHGQLGRITGLDPAEPEFEKHPISVRLDNTDARFVDVIHSNGASITKGGYGLMVVSGDIDFYVNGGEKQRGCPGQILGTLSALFHLQFGKMGKSVACSHSRAHDYFIESINTACPFTSYPCASYAAFERGECMDCGTSGCAQMGYYADQYATRASLYLDTNARAPYCGFMYNVKVKHRANGASTDGKLFVRLHGNFGVSKWLNITGEDTVKFQPGVLINKMVVANVEVGDISSVDIRYEKKSGLWGLGAGKDSLDSEQIVIKSGESGRTFNFCLRNGPLTHHNIMNVKPVAAARC
ncbi:hypothetical protein ScPMuIL_005944 [Solemya velum]